MAKQLLSVCALILCVACGLNDLESGSKFISKTQEDPSNYLSDLNKHRCYYQGDTLICGDYANAYLINKVHKKDHPTPEDRVNPYGSLTANVSVGWWGTCPAGGYTPHGTPRGGAFRIGTTGPTPCPACCTRTVDGNTESVADIVNYCISNTLATTEVNNAINKWLTPLRAPYNSVANPIVTSGASPGFVTGLGGADLMVNFVCSSSATRGNSNDCGSGSCTRYHKGLSVTDANPIDDNSATTAKNEAKAFNQPYIFIGQQNVPATSRNYDVIGQHDRLELLHEIGHAFGLADTHKADGTRIGRQPRSVMARDRIFVRGNTSLILGHDDEIGVQWLYEHHRRGIGTSTCHFSDEYGHETYTSETDVNEGCEPKYSLITALKNRLPNEALTILSGGTNSGININTREASTGYSALHYAIIQHASPSNTPTEITDYRTIIRTLLTYSGINLNIKDNLGKTPLHLAVQFNQQEIVISLLNATGIQVAEADNSSNTPLHYAADLGHAHLVSAMLASFSSYVGLKNRDGRTAMHLAAAAGHTDTVRAFSTYPSGIGTLASAEDNDGNTALHLAAENGKDAVVAVILQNDKTLLNDANNRDETPLHLAAKLGRTTTVTSLLQQTGIEVNPQDDQGNTPLHLSAMNNRPDVVRLLLNKNGIDPAITNNNSKTARDEAVSRRYTDVVAIFDGGDTRYGTSSAQRLIQALKVGNVDPNTYCGASDSECRQNSALSIIRADQNLEVNYIDTTTGNTALHYAVQGDDPDANRRGPYETVVDLLLRRTLIDPNLKNTNGSAPLHLAVQYNKLEVVKLLLRNRRLDVNATNNISETALHIAVDLGYEAIVAELLKYRTGNIDVNLQDDTGQAPLHIAAEQRDPAITQMLVDDRRVDVNLRSRNTNETALHIAAEYGNDEVVEALLSDADIDVNLQDSTGSTALHIAAHHGSAEVVTLLLDEPDIDLTILDNQQLSAYGRAKARGDKAIMKIFDDQKKGDDVVFRGTLMEVLRDKKTNEDVEDVALDILNDNEDDLDVNEKDSRNGKTPLHFAIEYEYTRLITKLLERNDIQVNLKDREGETPLIVAVRLAQTNTITKLLRISSLRVNETKANGDTALLIAVRAQEQAVVTLLTGHTNIDTNRKDRSGNTPLHLAVNSRNNNIVQSLLSASDIDVNIKDNRGNTPLHLAVNSKSSNIVQSLLSASDIDVNIKDNRGNTPLHLAVNSKSSNIVQSLLSASDIDVNIKDNNGNTALYTAVKNKDTAIVTQLVTVRSIDANQTDNAGNTPLHLAVKSKNSSIVRALLTITSIDINIKNRDGKTVLHIAVDNNDAAVVTELIRNNNINVNVVVTGTTGETALNIAIAEHIATTKNYSRIIDLLLAHTDIDPNIKNKHQESPLLKTTKEEETALITKLLAHTDTDVNTSNSRQKTPLMFAAERGSKKIVQQLLAHENININLQDDKQFTALHFAAHRGHVEIVRLLLAHIGINTNLKDKWNLTPRERARVRKHTKVVEVFNEYEAGNIGNAITLLKELERKDSESSVMALVNANQGNIAINAVDDANNYTALHYAAKLGYTQVVNALLEHDSIKVNEASTRRERPLHLAARRGYDRVVQALLAHKNIQVNTRDNRDATPLHRAAAGGHLSVVQKLLTHKDIRPALDTTSGYTALHWAAQLGYERIVRALLNKHATLINMKTDNQRTALYYATWFGHKATVQELLKPNDVNTNLRDAEGNTALHRAADYNRLEIARLLLNAGASTQISNKQRKKARDIAQDKGYTEMVELIDSY